MITDQQWIFEAGRAHVCSVNQCIVHYYIYRLQLGEYHNIMRIIGFRTKGKIFSVMRPIVGRVHSSKDRNSLN